MDFQVWVSFWCTVELLERQSNGISTNYCLAPVLATSDPCAGILRFESSIWCPVLPCSSANMRAYGIPTSCHVLHTTLHSFIHARLKNQAANFIATGFSELRCTSGATDLLFFPRLIHCFSVRKGCVKDEPRLLHD